MKQRKLERGITLIALVVTIIVLLILAGVSIQMLTGQSGILTQAQQARENTRGGEVKDAVALAVAENELAKNTGNGTVKTKEDVVQELAQGGKLTKEEEKELTKSDQITIGSIDIDFSKLEGGTTGGEKITAGDMGGDNLKGYQGKYVDIGLDINGTNDTYDDWRIFYVGNEEEGNRIFLIAADYVKNTKIPEETLTNTGLTQKSGTYNVYWSSPTWWESWPGYNKDGETETAKDMEYRKLIKHEQYSLIDKQASNPNSRAVSQLLNKDAWNKIVENAGKKEKIDFCIGGPTLEMWCAAWNASNAANDGFTNVYANGGGTSGYYVGSRTDATTTYYYMNGGSSLTSDEKTKLESNYPTFFPHTDGYEDCWGYWLASPSAATSAHLMRVDYTGSVHNNYYNNIYRGVRPVVCLTSEVQLQERETKEDGTTIYDLV